MAPSITSKANIMGKDTLALPKKNTATTSGQATPEKAATTPDTKLTDALTGVVPESNAGTAGDLKTEAVKTDSTAFKSTDVADNASASKKTENSAGDKTSESAKDAPAVPTKMELATGIYQQMKKTKGVTRKEILERFVSEAKLSKAGASTYFQLIKAKHP